MSYRTIAAVTFVACVLVALANVIAASILRQANDDDDWGDDRFDDWGEAYEPWEDA